MRAGRIEAVRVRGFRSLADVVLPNLRNANILIGANGSGKSNFVRFFEMMGRMLGTPRRLDEFVQKHGGADDQLYGGSTVTPALGAEVTLSTSQGRKEYRFRLSYAHPDRLVFAEERFRDLPGGGEDRHWNELDSGHREAALVHAAYDAQVHGVDRASAQAIADLLRDVVGYQFHDTSDRSSFKKRWDLEDDDYLRPDGGNLAAILHRLQREDVRRLDLICEHVRRVLPVFDSFQIDENYGKVLLRWKAVGSSKTVGAHLTSDGSLRFFALVTLLNLPGEMLPAVLLLDEPELGLHPVAVSLIGGMVKALAVDRQIFVATQSPLLVDAFDLDEIFVADLDGGRTRFRRLESKKYERWLDDCFTPGELWQKNLLGGRP